MCIHVRMYISNSHVNVCIYACPCACITSELENSKLETWDFLRITLGFCVATMYCFVNFIDLCSTKLLIPCHYARRKHGQSPSWALQLLWLHCGQPAMEIWTHENWTLALTLNGLNGSYTLYPRHGDMDLPLPTSQHDINFTP